MIYYSPIGVTYATTLQGIANTHNVIGTTAVFQSQMYSNSQAHSSLYFHQMTAVCWILSLKATLSVSRNSITVKSHER